MRWRSILTALPCLQLFCLASMLLASSGIVMAQSGNNTPANGAEDQSHEAGGVTVAIPVPWTGTVELDSDHRAAMNQFVPPYNRLVAAFVSPDDLQKINSGDRSTPPRIALVAISRQYEFQNVSESDFKIVIDGVRKQFDSTADSYAQENEEEFNRRLKSLDLDNVKITFEKPVSLGILFSKRNAGGFGTILQVSASDASARPASEVSSRKLLSVLFLRVKNRVLYAYIFADYKDQETVKWLRKASEAWADQILNANMQ